MKETKNLHPIQMNILRILLFKPKARFRDLNSEKIPSDHFNFHVKALLKLTLIEKANNQTYQLTTVGKEFANRFDSENSQMTLEKQAKIGVLVGCVAEQGKNQRYLIQQRLKEPFYGFYGFLSGKVKWGETVFETAARELEEETGLSAELSLVGVKHKMDYDTKGDLLEDKYFFIFRGRNSKGKLLETFEGGKNIWLT